MGGGESTTSSQSTNRPLTAAERQDLYRGALGNIINTYTQSGLPYGGVGSQTATPATYNPNRTIPMTNQGGTWSAGLSGDPSLYNATGGASTYSKGGKVTFDPKTYFQAPDPSTNMPTGARDPGGINLPVYETPEYQSPGEYKGIAEGDYQALQDALIKGYTAPLDAAKARDLESYNADAARRGVWSSGLALKGEGDIQEAYAPQYASAGGAATGQRYNLQTADLTSRNAYDLAAANAANAFNQSNVQNRFSAGWAPLNYLSGLWSGTGGQVGGSSTFGQSLNMSI